MAGFKDVFQRIEVKYLLDDIQYNELMKRLEGMAAIDSYGETSILNIYFDTPDFKLIERSLEKPKYKEKLRLRTYGIASDDTNAFIEIKKKYDGVVYKRRISMPYVKAIDYLVNGKELENKSQISNEIDYFLQYYKGLRPAMAISYDRIAMAGIEDPDLRITFDRNIRWRTENLSLSEGNVGKDILLPGQHLMELKIAGAMSMELARILDELNIRKISFSKYGRGYLEYMYGQTNEMIMKGIVPEQKKEKSNVAVFRRAV
ncbi:MAG: polyphosphate polymerase domain-containing protein [Butyrivibrio sp.]|uniref:polyphosphate polymerase domain-containing protein n=1 Tax=Butyrivibrio sp. TaxID=28121 RepID=UPI001B2D44FE|nr:polyphosphate polymerase domain-containing protein [Butyrivibrio sp.]MBO6242441.1 polyphosphate polymerase domain-containing protein [Butyrivibrio sp.]